MRYPIIVLIIIIRFSTALYAQEKVRDTSAVAGMHPKNFLYTDTYFLPGIGSYKQVDTARFAANVGLKVAYRFSHLFLNAGLGFYYMRSINNDGYTVERVNKFLFEVPVGGGLYLQKGKFNFQAGIDAVFLTSADLNKAENGLAFSPHLNFMWDSKNATGFGVILKSTINSQRHDVNTYDPAFFGIGLVVRYY